MDETTLPETSISMSIPELIEAISKRTSLAKEDVGSVVNAFIDYELKRFKL